MEFIHRLPLILGALMAVIVGFISYINGVSQQQTYIRMSVVTVVFFIIGIVIRGTITAISEEVAESLQARKRQEELEEHERLMEEQQKKAAEQEQSVARVIDYRVDDQSEEFTPMKVSEYISTKVNE